MELILHTEVAGNYTHVLDRFTQDLFLVLAPAFPKLQLLRFDGSQPGDVIAVELQIGPIKQPFTSLISERSVTNTQAWFTDEGQVLPPPLKRWKHRHLCTKLTETTTRITDHITFSTGLVLLDCLVYPVLYAQFAARKPIYQQYFGTPKPVAPAETT